MKKIVVLDGYTENPGDLSWEGFEAMGELKVYDRTPPEETVERIRDAEIVITNKTKLGAAEFKACPNMEYVGVLATGYNVVDVVAAAGHGITVTNIPTYGTDAVAQFVFALLLEICHHAWDHNLAVKKGDWTNNADFCFWNYPLTELAGKTMGIIGYGRIGRATGSIAQAFGMKVLAFDKNQDKSLESETMAYADLDTLLSGSDVISLHCPLFPETEGIMNADNIAKCKDGVIIINTSRGGLVAEADMAEALISGKVSNFAADVVSTEPIEMDNPLLAAPNTILTPHIAWAPLESRKRLMDTAVRNLHAYLSGKPQNTVS